MMRNIRFVPAALAAVLVLGACGSADDAAPPVGSGLRAPTPIEFTTGGSGDRVSSEAAVAADDMGMIAPWFDVEYVLGDGLVAPADDTGYVYDASAEVTAAQVAALAAALGVEGEPVRVDDGWMVSWRVGPDDGSAPSLWVNDDAQQYWNYSSAWAEDVMVREACAVSVDSEGVETIEDCPEPEPPVGVPTAAEAEQRVREALTSLGIDPTSVEFDTYADDWSASVTANDRIDARGDLRSWYFSFGAEGVMQYAGGTLASPEAVGPYPLVDIATAFERLQDQTYGWSMGGGVMAVDDMAVAAEPAVDIAVAPEPMPVEEMPVDGTVPEPETLVVTLVDVQADLWWAWDVDGTVWLLPAYRFIGDDGGWYTVPAVTDEYLIQVDPPAVSEPMPVDPIEPDQGGGVDGVAPPSDLTPLIGGPLDEFTAVAEADGWTVRVVEIDGESLAVTEDYSETRINVAVETVAGVEVVVRAITDGGIVIGEAGVGGAASVEVTAVYEGIEFYPGCGNETLRWEGTTWYQVQQSDFPEEYAAVVGVDRVMPESVQGFAKVVPPGPGDDVGTLTVWADGVARFVSDSGDLSTWMVDDELTYDWVC
jgi:hypothetical protein